MLAPVALAILRVEEAGATGFFEAAALEVLEEEEAVLEVREVDLEAVEVAASDFFEAADLDELGDSLRMVDRAVAAIFATASLVEVFAARVREGRVAGVGALGGILRLVF